MPAARISKKVKDQLRDAYITDLAAAWAHARSRHGGETPYALVLYGTEGCARFTPHVLTEESLTQVARKYLPKGIYDTLEAARAGLRYSVADSPHFNDLLDDLPTVQGLAQEYLACLDETAGYRVQAEAAMQALLVLDQQGLFGTGKQREQFLLILITEDTEEEWSRVSAMRLNPEPTFAALEKQLRIEGHYASCDVLALSRDGTTLYAAGSRKLPAETPRGEEQSVDEVVALDAQSPRLRRLWTHVSQESVRGVASASGHAGIYTVSSTRTDGVWQIRLLHIAGNPAQAVRQQLFGYEPSGLAASPDGHLLAVASFARKVHLFTSELQPLGVYDMPAKPHGLLFLRTGELLVACETSFLVLNPATGTVKATVHVPAYRFSVDDRESLLAVSGWFPISGSGAQQNKEFGVELLRLPAFEPVRSVLVPNYRAVTAELSPDGRILAFEAHECGTFRKFVMAFDAATGREIARRKSDFIHDLAFLRDNRTLAIAKSGIITSGEPIDLWPIEPQSTPTP